MTGMPQPPEHLNHKLRHTFESLTEGKAPRNLHWNDFVSLWQALADSVETESGDRVVFTYQGERVVFHKPKDDMVPINDVEEARRLLRA